MHGHGLVQTTLLGGSGAGLVACFALLAFCGLLRPLERRTRVASLRRARPKNPATPTVRLNAVELGLLAELSLEQARAHDQVVDDASQRPETRRSAAATATAWRDRARAFQSHARRLGAAPMGPGEHFSQAYTGPERRRQSRRCQTRRTGAPTSAGIEPADRRTLPDRRQGDRRRPELASG